MGFFMTVRASYAQGYEREADQLLDALRQALHKRGLPDYIDPTPPPNVYNGSLFGRSALDHHSASVLCKLNDFATNHGIGGQFSLRGDRAIHLPFDFPDKLPVRYGKGLSFFKKVQDFGSLPQLVVALRQLAPHLGIPLENGEVQDDVVQKINDFAPLYESDSCELAEDERTAWLVMYEGARLAQKHRVALTCA